MSPQIFIVIPSNTSILEFKHSESVSPTLEEFFKTDPVDPTLYFMPISLYYPYEGNHLQYIHLKSNKNSKQKTWNYGQLNSYFNISSKTSLDQNDSAFKRIDTIFFFTSTKTMQSFLSHAMNWKKYFFHFQEIRLLMPRYRFINIDRKAPRKNLIIDIWMNTKRTLGSWRWKHPANNVFLAKIFDSYLPRAEYIHSNELDHSSKLNIKK